LSNGETPSIAYDPKSLEHILAGTYPVENGMVEMDAFTKYFKNITSLFLDLNY
jgi:hypothetical protein